MKPTIKPYAGKLGVAVSGGMDSMVLFHLLRAVQKDLVVINIEHGIRGEESLSDSEFVSTYCALCGVECMRFSVDTLHNMKQGESVELAARRLRYEVFDRLLAEKKVDAIALAHHADDNAETILMRIFRGTGIRGLVGMGERKGYIRPLIGTPHKAIEEYAEKYGVPYVTDSTNLTDECTRNYIRHEILPRIKVAYPSVTEAFTRLSDNAAEVDEYLSSCAPDAEKTDFGYVVKSCFDRPKILQKYALKRFFESIGVFQDVEKSHYDAVTGLDKKPNNTVTGLPFGYRMLRLGKDLYLTDENAETFEKTSFSPDRAYVFCGKKYTFETGEGVKKGATICAEKIPENAVVRQRKDGDVFCRVNGKNKLLSDFLNEKKLTAFEKERLLVLASDSVVLAVLGIETADLVKAETGKKTYHIITERV